MPGNAFVLEARERIRKSEEADTGYSGGDEGMRLRFALERMIPAFTARGAQKRAVLYLRRKDFRPDPYQDMAPGYYSDVTNLRGMAREVADFAKQRGLQVEIVLRQHHDRQDEHYLTVI